MHQSRTVLAVQALMYCFAGHTYTSPDAASHSENKVAQWLPSRGVLADTLKTVRMFATHRHDGFMYCCEAIEHGSPKGQLQP